MVSPASYQNQVEELQRNQYERDTLSLVKTLAQRDNHQMEKIQDMLEQQLTAATSTLKSTLESRLAAADSVMQHKIDAAVTEAKKEEAQRAEEEAERKWVEAIRAEMEEDVKERMQREKEEDIMVKHRKKELAALEKENRLKSLMLEDKELELRLRESAIAEHVENIIAEQKGQAEIIEEKQSELQGHYNKIASKKKELDEFERELRARQNRMNTRQQEEEAKIEERIAFLAAEEEATKNKEFEMKKQRDQLTEKFKTFHVEVEELEKRREKLEFDKAKFEARESLFKAQIMQQQEELVTAHTKLLQAQEELKAQKERMNQLVAAAPMLPEAPTAVAAAPPPIEEGEQLAAMPSMVQQVPMLAAQGYRNNPEYSRSHVENLAMLGSYPYNFLLNGPGVIGNETEQEEQNVAAAKQAKWQQDHYSAPLHSHKQIAAALEAAEKAALEASEEAAKAHTLERTTKEADDDADIQNIYVDDTTENNTLNNNGLDEETQDVGEAGRNPSPPPGLKLVEIGSNHVTLSWRPYRLAHPDMDTSSTQTDPMAVRKRSLSGAVNTKHSNPQLNYIVTIYQPGLKFCPVTPRETQYTSIKLVGLDPQTNYEVNVMALSQYGKSNRSVKAFRTAARPVLPQRHTQHSTPNWDQGTQTDLTLLPPTKSWNTSTSPGMTTMRDPSVATTCSPILASHFPSQKLVPNSAPGSVKSNSSMLLLSGESSKSHLLPIKNNHEAMNVDNNNIRPNTIPTLSSGVTSLSMEAGLFGSNGRGTSTPLGGVPALSPMSGVARLNSPLMAPQSYGGSANTPNRLVSPSSSKRLQPILK